MRFTDITIGRQTYPLCYSTRVHLAVHEKFGGLDHFASIIDSSNEQDKKVDALTWTIEQMLQGGVRYIQLTGGESRTDWPSQGNMCDLLSMADMMTAVIGCIKAGSEREIDIDPPKNAMATGGA